jgi:hypothetical protein
MPEKKYEIGGKIFIQRPLLVGQLVPLVTRTDGVIINSLDAKSVVSTLGDKLNSVLAVIMIPEGVDVKSRDLDEIERHLDNYLEVSTATEIVGFFFDSTPPSLLLSLIKIMMGKMATAVETALDLTKLSVDSFKTSVMET